MSYPEKECGDDEPKGQLYNKYDEVRGNCKEKDIRCCRNNAQTNNIASLIEQFS